MNDESFESNINELRKLYQNDKDVTSKNLKDCIRKTHNDISDIRNNKKLSRNEVIWLWSMIGVIALAGLFNPKMYFFYLASSLFFFSGHFIGMKVRGFGLIFLFSHSVTGMILMISSFFSAFEGSSSETMARFTDISQNAIVFAGATAILFVVATVLVIIYNVSNKIKEKDHSFLYPITLYAIAFVMAGLFSTIMFTI